MPWKSGGDQSSNMSNRGQRLSNNDGDTDKNHNDVSAKFGNLTIQTSENSFSSKIASPPNRQQRSELLQAASPKSSSQQRSPSSFQQKLPTSFQQKSPTSFQQKSPTKLNPSNLEQFSRSPKKPQMPDYSGMPPLEPAFVDEMPPLEPIETETELIEVFVANFPYHETTVSLAFYFLYYIYWSFTYPLI